jgi:hypothetical protein
MENALDVLRILKEDIRECEAELHASRLDLCRVLEPVYSIHRVFASREACTLENIGVVTLTRLYEAYADGTLQNAPRVGEAMMQKTKKYLMDLGIISN